MAIAARDVQVPVHQGELTTGSLDCEQGESTQQAIGSSEPSQGKKCALGVGVFTASLLIGFFVLGPIAKQAMNGTELSRHGHGIRKFATVMPSQIHPLASAHKRTGPVQMQIPVAPKPPAGFAWSENPDLGFLDKTATDAKAAAGTAVAETSREHSKPSMVATISKPKSATINKPKSEAETDDVMDHIHASQTPREEGWVHFDANPKTEGLECIKPDDEEDWLCHTPKEEGFVHFDTKPKDEEMSCYQPDDEEGWLCTPGVGWIHFEKDPEDISMSCYQPEDEEGWLCADDAWLKTDPAYDAGEASW
jgi:hypothetical protein